MSALIAIPLILFSISGYILFPTVKFHISFQKSPLIGFSCLFIAQYFFVLMGIGQIGIIFAFILNVVLLLLSVQLLVKRKSRDDLSGILYPFLVFFGFLLICGLLFRNRSYTKWDEFAFWDAFVRSLFISGEKSPTIIHADYPLGISLIQYYFVAISKYNEGIIIFGILSVLFSGIFFCCPDLSGKNICYALLLVIFSVLVLYICDMPVVTINIDGLMGIIFGALIFFIFTTEQKGRSFAIQLAVILFFFVSLKITCIIFLGILFLALLTGSDLYSDNNRKNMPVNNQVHTSNLPKILSILIIITGPLIAFFSWQIRNQIVKPMQVFSTKRLTFENIRLIFSADIANREQKIYEGVLDHIFEFDFFSTKIPAFILISALLFIAVIFFILEKTNFSKNFLKLNTVLLFGFIGYTIFLFLFASFVQEPELGEQLNSFDRYIGTYLIAWVISYFAILIRMISVTPSGLSRKLIPVVCMSIFVYIFTVSPIKSVFAPPVPEKSSWIQQVSVYKQFSGIIPKGSIVQNIDIGSSGLPCQMLNNLFVGHSYFIWNPCSNPADFALRKDEFADYIEESGADYILVQQGNDYFWNEFSEMFDYPWHGQIFEVVGRGDYRRVLPGQ